MFPWSEVGALMALGLLCAFILWKSSREDYEHRQRLLALAEEDARAAWEEERARASYEKALRYEKDLCQIEGRENG